MNRIRSSRPSRWLMCCMLLAAGGAMAQSQPAPDLVEAVWKPQQLRFAYRGYNTFYTCDGLREKLQVILGRLGARDGVRILSYDCIDGGGPAQFQIGFDSPVEATPENVRLLTTFDATQRLAARTRAEQLPTAESLQRFAATWQTISFARDPKMKLSAVDCELVRQLRKSILPQLSVKVQADKVRCSMFGPVGAPRLTVDALIASKEP